MTTEDPLNYVPSIIDLQEAADARGEDGPLDNPRTALREVKHQANRIVELEESLKAIVRAHDRCQKRWTLPRPNKYHALVKNIEQARKLVTKE